MKNIKGYISREELMEAVETLTNPQDRFILMAIYNGIAGKNNMSDLLGLKVKDVDFENHTITIGDRVVNMDSDFEKVTLDTIEENTYYLESDSKYTNKGNLLAAIVIVIFVLHDKGIIYLASSIGIPHL